MEYIVQQSDTGIELERFNTEDEAEIYIKNALFDDAAVIAASMFPPQKVEVHASKSEKGQIVIDIRRFDTETEAKSALEEIRRELTDKGYIVCDLSADNDCVVIVCEPGHKAEAYYEIVEG